MFPLGFKFGDYDNSKSLILDVAILCEIFGKAILSHFGMNIGFNWNNNVMVSPVCLHFWDLTGVPPGKSSSWAMVSLVKLPQATM